MLLPSLLCGLLPASATKNRLLSRSARKWQIAASARVGSCIFWRVGELRIGAGAYVGPGNVIRDMNRVLIGDGAELGQFNWISGAAQFVPQAEDNPAATLKMASQSAITSRHYLDCSGGFSIGRLSILAGVKSTVLTHSVDVMASAQHAALVSIGERCFIAACALITAGVTIADRCVVAAGSVVVKDLLESETLYAGAPARAVRSIAGATFFERCELRMVPRDLAEALLKEARRARS